MVQPELPVADPPAHHYHELPTERQHDQDAGVHVEFSVQLQPPWYLLPEPNPGQDHLQSQLQPQYLQQDRVDTHGAPRLSSQCLPPSDQVLETVPVASSHRQPRQQLLLATSRSFLQENYVVKTLHRELIELRNDKLPAPTPPVKEPNQAAEPQQLQPLKALRDLAKKVTKQGVHPTSILTSRGGIVPLHFERPDAYLVIGVGFRLPKQRGGTKHYQGPRLSDERLSEQLAAEPLLGQQ